MSPYEFYLIPSGEVKIDRQLEPRIMMQAFESVRAYLKGKAAIFDRKTLSDMCLLAGTSTLLRTHGAIHRWEKAGRPTTTIFIASGGKLKPDAEQLVSDALIIACILVMADVPPDQIVLEEMAADTFENVRLSLLILTAYPCDVLKGRQLTVFSEKNHLRRFWWAYRRLSRSGCDHHGNFIPQLNVTYVDTGPRLSAVGTLVEWGLFLLVHLPDPLGTWHPLAARNRKQRRANGRAT